MQSKVVIQITNVWLYVVGDLSTDLRDEIQTKLSYVVPGFKFMASYKAMEAKAEEMGTEPEWDGTKTVARIIQGRLRAPTGLLSYIREVLNERKVPYEIQEHRLPATQSSGWSTPNLILRDYQKECSLKALDRERGVLKMSTGAGKTETVIDNIVRASCFPAVFYVPSCDLLEQAYDRFRQYIQRDGHPAEIGRIGAGHCDIKPITIATVQSCQLALSGKFTKYQFDDVDQDDDDTKFSEAQKADIISLVKEAQYVYNDECQHTSAETIQTVLNSSYKARFRIGGSASPWRDDGLDILIEACFGRKICDIDASFLINSGYLIRPQITFNHFRQYLGKAANFNAHYTKFIVENEARNKFIAERAKFHIERDRPTVIIVKWSRHAEILHDLLPETQVLTSSGKHKLSPKRRKEVLNLMRERKLMGIIGTTLLDEGVDVPSAGAGILAGGGKSSTRALQRVGRFIRPDKQDPNKDIAYIEEFFDHCRWLDHHAKARRRIYETEREFQLSDNRETLNS